MSLTSIKPIMAGGVFRWSHQIQEPRNFPDVVIRAEDLGIQATHVGFDPNVRVVAGVVAMAARLKEVKTALETGFLNKAENSGQTEILLDEWGRITTAGFEQEAEVGTCYKK